MAACDFCYHRPATLAAACELGKRYGERARYLAGGTELLVDYRNGRETAGQIISLKDVPGLNTIEADGAGLRIGAMATLADITESPLVAERYPALAEGVLTMAGDQVRALATVGGNFCRAVSCADTPPICMVGKAQLTISSKDGDRPLAAEELFTGPRQTQLAAGEILTAIRIPAQPAGSGVSYQRFSLRRGQALAVASVAARIVLEGDRITEARIALGAVAPTPMLAPRSAEMLCGEAPGADLFARVADEAAAESRPISDLRGSASYRRELIAILTRRALSEAAGRAREVRP